MTDLLLSMHMEAIAAFIDKAQERVVLVTPGLHPPVLASVMVANERLPGRVLVAIDSSEEVFRLGYGLVDVLQTMQEAGVSLLRREGLRLGVLLVDDEAWCFAPTALLVEADSPGGLPRLNGCSLPESQALRQLRALCGSQELEQALKGPLALEPEMTVAIPVTKTEVEVIRNIMVANPPRNFDLHRQILVYQSYVQFVEFSFRGGNPSSVKARVPKELLPIGASPELESHLQTTVDLFQNKVGDETAALQTKVDELRKKYLRSLGDPYGNVVLAREVPDLLKGVEALSIEIGQQQLKLAKLMEEERSQTITDLTVVCTANLMRAPTGWLKSRLREAVTKEDRVRFEVTALLDKRLPKAFQLAGRMELECFLKDFTFGSLKDETIFAKLRDEFPDEDWDKPYRAAEAALESKQQR